MWAECIHISDGDVIYRNGILEVRKRFSELEDDDTLIEVEKTAT